jgi:hypothetical protein
VPLVPGQVLSHADLRVAEKKLAELGRFVVDADKGIRPTIRVFEGEGQYRDILISVLEKPGDVTGEMFPEGRTHDLGVVTRGIAPSPIHVFPIVNTTNAPITFGKVRSSSGAVTAEIRRFEEKELGAGLGILQPKQKCGLYVVVDTRRFMGEKTMTLYVEAQTADGPQEFRFTIRARSDDSSPKP